MVRCHIKKHIALTAKEYPLNGACFASNVIYEAKAINGVETKYYIEVTEGEQKRILYNHKMSLSNSKYKGSATLSTYYQNAINSGKEVPTIT